MIVRVRLAQVLPAQVVRDIADSAIYDGCCGDGVLTVDKFVQCVKNINKQWKVYLILFMVHWWVLFNEMQPTGAHLRIQKRVE